MLKTDIPSFPDKLLLRWPFNYKKCLYVVDMFLVSKDLKLLNFQLPTLHSHIQQYEATKHVRISCSDISGYYLQINEQISADCSKNYLHLFMYWQQDNSKIHWKPDVWNTGSQLFVHSEHPFQNMAECHLFFLPLPPPFSSTFSPRIVWR